MRRRRRSRRASPGCACRSRTRRSCATSRATRRLSNPRRAATTTRSSSTPRAPRASSPKRSSTRTGPIVTLMLAALYGTGLRPGDRFFCPSSPAWGHGLWHGTLAPLALGLTVGAFCRQVQRRAAAEGAPGPPVHQLSAAATHYRMMRNSGAAPKYTLLPREALLHRRADRQRDRGLRRSDLRPSGVQHVRHDRDRRDPGELSGRERLPGQARLARQADPRRESRGAGRERPAVPARRHRRAEGVAPRRLDPDQGPGTRRRGRLLLSRGAAPTTSSSPPAGP